MTGLPVSTIYLLKRAELAVRGCVEMALGEVAVTPSQYFILVLVRFGEGTTSSADLARAMGVLPQSMTELIAPLEQQGVIARRPDPANKRILRIRLTAAGERLFDKATEVARRLERELLEGFTAADLERLNGTLLELTAKAETHAHHPKLRRLTRTAANPKPRRATPTPDRRHAANRG